MTVYQQHHEQQCVDDCPEVVHVELEQLFSRDQAMIRHGDEEGCLVVSNDEIRGTFAVADVSRIAAWLRTRHDARAAVIDELRERMPVLMQHVYGAAADVPA